jgi:signal transduction histidine kinase
VHPFDEMKAYVRFDEEDALLLRDLWSTVEPRTREVADVFYDRVLEFESARTVFRDDAQVRRLKLTLQRWLEELLTGPHDVGYWERRRRIGEKHVQVRLPHRFMFTAMVVVQEHLCRIAQDAYGGERADRLCAAIHKITSLDLAIMTGTFHGATVANDVAEAASVLLARLPAPALLLDRAGVVVASTDEARRVLGPVDGRPWREVMPPELLDAGDLEAAVARAGGLGEETGLDRVDAVIEGRNRSWRLRVQPIVHPRLAVLLLADEITEALAAEAERRRIETLAQIGTMSATVAHELRNPLAGISGAVQVLSGSMAEGDPRRPVMGKVRDQIDRLDRMVRDLLAFSRPVEPRLVRVDLVDLAALVVDLVRRQEPRAAVALHGEGAALADPDLVHRIVLNLVQNALAATERLGPVTVSVAPGEVRVADEGPGVPAELASRIFEPFFTTKTTGTGLGLALCRNAARAMGGEVELVPGPVGATFRLTLPRADVPER